MWVTVRLHNKWFREGILKCFTEWATLFCSVAWWNVLNYKQDLKGVVYHVHESKNWHQLGKCYLALRKDLPTLSHWGRVTHIWVSKLTIIGSENGLAPGRRQAIIWTNAGILLIGPLETNLSEVLIKVYTFSFKKMHLKCRLVLAAILSRPQQIYELRQQWG